MSLFFLTFASSATETGLSEKSNRNNTPRVTKITFGVFEFLFGVFEITSEETKSGFFLVVLKIIHIFANRVVRIRVIDLTACLCHCVTPCD